MEVTTNISKSLEFYSKLYTKELEEFTQIREIEFYGKDISECTYSVIFPSDILIHIFQYCFHEDMLNVAQTNRAAFINLNNFNGEFWIKYSNGIVNLNLNPEKSVFSCMINARAELRSLVNNWISRIEPFQTYIFQGSFISSPDENGNKTLLEPAFEIQVGKDTDNPIISKWIFRNEFMPEFCYLPDTIKPGNDSKIPRNIVYFNIENMPTFIQADYYVENQTVESELFLWLLKKERPNLKLRDRKSYEGNEQEFIRYASFLKSGYKEVIECLKHPKLYESIIAETIAPAYALTFSEEEKPLFNIYIQNKAAFIRKNNFLEQMKMEGNPEELILFENSLDKRIETITSPNYISSSFIVQPKPKVPKPVDDSGINSGNIVVAAVVTCIALSIFSSFASET